MFHYFELLLLCLRLQAREKLALLLQQAARFLIGDSRRRCIKPQRQSGKLLFQRVMKLARDALPFVGAPV